MKYRPKSPGTVLLILLILISGLSACRPSKYTPTADLPPTTGIPSHTSTATLPPSATSLPTKLPATSTPTLRPTPDPYAGLRISELAGDNFGQGTLTVYRWTQPSSAFQRGFFHYPSDGLTVHGFMNVPHGEGPFPVVIFLHGYIDPDDYQTLAYTTRYANALAASGYVVLHPNFRNYPPSDEGPNPFRVGYARDVLHLIAIIRQQGGTTKPLEVANPEAIGLMGHSMGGGVSLRVISIDPAIDAAVLYGSMSGDEARNYQKIQEWSEGERGQEELGTPRGVLQDISPIYHLNRIQAAVSIHHGEADNLVPPEWSLELCQLLRKKNKTVECFTYPGMPHTFYGEHDQLLVDRAVQFFREHLDSQP